MRRVDDGRGASMTTERLGGASTGSVTRSLTILVAPDSFKGSLTAVQVARALAARLGTRPARRRDRALPARRRRRRDTGCHRRVRRVERADSPGHRSTRAPGRARWLRSDDGARAVIEMAEASGLSRVDPGDRDAIAASSVGTGELIRLAVDAGVTSIVLGIGGSATTDGGAGLLSGLGGKADRDAAKVDLTGSIRAWPACRFPSRVTSRTHSSDRKERPLSTVPKRAPRRRTSPTLTVASSGSPEQSNGRSERSFATSRGPALRAASVSRCWPSVRVFDRSLFGPASSSSWRRQISTRASREPTW